MRVTGIPAASRNRCERSNTESVGGLGRCGQRGFSALALLICDLALRDRDLALPVGEPSQDDRNHKSGNEAAGQNIAPPACAAAALGEKGLRILGRRRRIGRA